MEFDLVTVATIFLCLVFSLTVHEAAHAAMATWRGDDTARLLGRLTLNPLAHVDLIGTIILPLILMLSSGMMFGWAKPVPFNPRRLKDSRLDPVLIAMAGPASNLAIAAVVIVVARVISETVGLEALSDGGFMLIMRLISLNLILMLFNLIPVPPLDGHYVLNYFLPPAGQQMMQQIGPFGILIAIIIAQPLLGRVMAPMFEFVARAIGVS